jgi:hypothetical protein
VARGGKRPGAGRRRGAATKKTVEIAAAAFEQGITPLEVLLFTMRYHFDAKRYDDAADIAHDAAPYMHPRLSAIQHDISYSDAEADAALDAEIEELLASRADTGADAAAVAAKPINGHAEKGNGAGPVAGGPAPLF